MKNTERIERDNRRLKGELKIVKRELAKARLICDGLKLRMLMMRFWQEEEAKRTIYIHLVQRGEDESESEQ